MSIDMLTRSPEKITQGSIIQSVFAHQYPINETWGLVVTARCDIANKSKGVPHIHYIPIVPISRYIEFELSFRILKRKIQKEKEDLKRLLALRVLVLKARNYFCVQSRLIRY